MSVSNGKGPDSDEAQVFSFNRQSEQEDEDTLLGGLDLIRIFYILKRNILWLLLIPILALLGGYLYLRYTKPLYESSSSIKLEIKREANVLGLTGVTTQEDLTANLSGEIELIKSKLIYDDVIKKMDLSVSYYAYGKILDEERYKNSPFNVQYEMHTDRAYDKVFDLTFVNNNQFELSYRMYNTEFSSTYSFGQLIKTNDFSFIIDTTGFYTPDLDHTKYYFTINSVGALNNYLAANIRVDVLNQMANILGISFKDYHVLKARDVVNTIDTVYLSKTLELKNKANKQKIEFLEEQLRNTEENLERYESQQENFIVENKTADVKADVSKYINTIEELLRQKTDLNSQLSLLNNLYKLIENEGDLTSFVPSIPLLPDPQLGSLTENINSLQQERALALSSSKETTFAIKQSTLR